MDITSATQMYLNSLPSPLKKEEIEELFKKYQTQNDNEAREKIIKHNLKLALGIVFDRFSNAPMDFDDTLQLATVGLVMATDTYSLDKNVSFTTYATACITHSVLKEVNNRNQMLKIASLSINNEPSPYEDEYKCPSSQTFLDLTPDETESHIAHDYQKKVFFQKLEELIETEFTPEEKFVYNGLTGRNLPRPLLLREIAKELNVTHPMVIYIKHSFERKIFRKLKNDYVSLECPPQYFD